MQFGELGVRAAAKGDRPDPEPIGGSYADADVAPPDNEIRHRGWIEAVRGSHRHVGPHDDCTAEHAVA